jgi:release factor glutamine methyltransferase
MTIKESIVHLKNDLKPFLPDTEIQSLIYIVLNHITHLNKTEILMKYDMTLPQATILQINKIVSELKENKPIQYILGETEFYGLPFKVTPDVLIPRQETEELADWIIKENKGTGLRILDIGTGSGCIAIALAYHLANCTVEALDVSAEALNVARENALLNKISINFFQYDLLNDLPGLHFSNYDLIVSNPPYVCEFEKGLMQPNVLDFEPHLALFVPDEDALIFYKAILNFAKRHLNPGGKIYFEINEKLGTELKGLIESNGFDHVSIHTDINGKDRMAYAQLSTNHG